MKNNPHRHLARDLALLLIGSFLLFWLGTLLLAASCCFVPAIGPL